MKLVYGISGKDWSRDLMIKPYAVTILGRTKVSKNLVTAQPREHAPMMRLILDLSDLLRERVA